MIILHIARLSRDPFAGVNVAACNHIIAQQKTETVALLNIESNDALWMKLLSEPVKAVGEPKVLMHYRQVPGSRNEKKFRSAVERWKVYRDYLHLGVGKSAAAFCLYAVNGLKKYGL